MQLAAGTTRLMQLLGAGGLGYLGHEYIPKDWIERQVEMLRVGGDTQRTGELTKVLSQLGSKLDTLNTTTKGAPSSQTIVVRGDSSSGTTIFRTVTIVAVFAGVGYVYLRFWRGLRLDDFKLATQGSLKDAVAGFKGSFDSMQGVVTSVRTALAERIERVKETIHRVRQEVAKVHDDVREVKTDVDATRSLAESCDRRLEETSAKQDYANRGIHALCAVVGELLHNAAKTPAIDNLRHFTMLGRPARADGTAIGDEEKIDGNAPRLAPPPVPPESEVLRRNLHRDNDDGAPQGGGGFATREGSNGPETSLSDHLRAVEAAVAPDGANLAL